MARVVSKLGERVNRALARRGWSQREAARQAASLGYELSFSTMQSLSAGMVPGPEKILAFALAAGDDPNKLFAAAGYPLRYDPTVLTETDDPDRALCCAA